MKIGVTRFDLLDLLDSMFATPHTASSRANGALVHHANGALLAVAWAYGAAIDLWPANWIGGGLSGLLLAILALVLLSSLGAVHPAIRRGAAPDPGPAATRMGAATPVVGLLGHLVYGVVLGLLYHGKRIRS